MRVFVGTVEIAGYYSNLAKGLRSLGVDCDFFTFSSHPFGYGGESTPSWSLKFIQSLYQVSQPKLVGWIMRRIAGLLSIPWGLHQVRKYDAFIFGFGSSLLPWNLDLPVYRLLRKSLVVNLAHGSEARPPYVDGSYQSRDGKPFNKGVIRSLAIENSSRLHKFERTNAVIVGAPFSTSQFARERFVNTFAIGIPFDKPLPGPNINRSPSRASVVIVHAPSHPAAKGSIRIEGAIDALISRGYRIEFQLLSGKSNREVLAALANCDFVVDQIYSDGPLPGIATEAAALAKPTVVAGYGLNHLRQFVPEGMWPPSKTCHPDELEQSIEDLIVNAEERAQLGLAARQFVEEKWSAQAVAERYIRLIEGDIPEEWWLDPREVVYVEGAGQSVERSKTVINQLVRSFGASALQLQDKPELERAFLEFAGLEKRFSRGCPEFRCDY